MLTEVADAKAPAKKAPAGPAIVMRLPNAAGTRPKSRPGTFAWIKTDIGMFVMESATPSRSTRAKATGTIEVSPISAINTPAAAPPPNRYFPAVVRVSIFPMTNAPTMAPKAIAAPRKPSSAGPSCSTSLV